MKTTTGISFFDAIVLSITGLDREIFALCSSPERSHFRVVALAMTIPLLTGALAASQIARYLGFSATLNVLFIIGFTVVIWLTDRLIVSGLSPFRSHNVLDKLRFEKSKVTLALSRIALVLVLGTITSTCLCLKVFEDQISKSLFDGYQIEKQQIELGFDSKKEKLDEELQILRAEAQRRTDSADCEVTRFGRRGKGPIYEVLQRTAEDAWAEFFRKDSIYAVEIESYRAEMESRLEALSLQFSNTGLALRLDEFGRLRDSNRNVRITWLLIVLMLLLLDTIPLLCSLCRSRSEYFNHYERVQANHVKAMKKSIDRDYVQRVHIQRVRSEKSHSQLLVKHLKDLQNYFNQTIENVDNSNFKELIQKIQASTMRRLKNIFSSSNE